MYKLRKADLQIAAIEIKNLVKEGNRDLQTESEIYEMALIRSGYKLYKTHKTRSNIYTRLTLPLYFIVIVLMGILMPVNYILRGRWSYESIFMVNWATRLGF